MAITRELHSRNFTRKKHWKVKVAMAMEEMMVRVDKFDLTCRTCLCNCENGLSFNVHNFQLFDNTAVADVLSKCALIHISEDDALPKQLCQQCLSDLTNSYNFISKCRKSEQTLLDVLNQKNQIVLKFETVETPSEEIRVEVEEIHPSATTEAAENHLTQQVPPLEFHDHLYTTRNFTCNSCQKSFTSQYHLDIHSRTHTNNKPFRCDQCPASFVAKGHLKQHLIVHSDERPFVCDFCGKAFLRKGDLKKHQNSQNQDSPFVCHTCSERFEQRCTLVRHWETKHNVVEEEENSSAKCKICGRTFPSLISLRRHERKHDVKEFKCTECTFRFRTEIAWEIHLRLHRGERPLTCEQCGKAFKDSRALQFHSYIHTGEKPYVCKECGKGFKQPTHLKTHFSIMHSQEKPFRCGLCNKGFTMKSSLVIHKRRHTGERPYVCHVCRETFISNEVLKKHFKVHAPEIDAEQMNGN